MLTPWERATIPAAAVQPGWLTARWQWPLTLAATLGLLVSLGALHSWWALALAPILARALTLDATAYLLPHIYTLPLIVGGLAVGQGLDNLWPMLVLLVMRELALRSPYPIGLSGGDFLLLIAMLAWLTPLHTCLAAAAGSLLCVPLTFLKPKNAIPLGVPLIIGWGLLPFIQGLFSGG